MLWYRFKPVKLCTAHNGTLPDRSKPMTKEPNIFPVSLPRYQQVSEVLAREIRQGRYPVGSLLLPEPQLCEQFGVSRHTLREAVRRLCEIGLVTRLQGIGTRVIASQGQSHYTASLGSLQDLMQYSQRTRIKRLSDQWVTTDASLAALLNCHVGERWLEIETCRYPFDTDVPLVHMRIFVRPECEAIREELEHSDSWVFGLVEKHGGERIVEARQVVGAIAMPSRAAQILNAKAGAPALQVRRYYMGRNDRLLSVSLNVYAASRFEIDTRWRLTGNGEGS